MKRKTEKLPKREPIKKSIKIELILAIVISTLLIAALVFDQDHLPSISYTLILIFAILKIFNIIREEQHTFEEYVLLSILGLYLLMEIFLNIKTNSLLNIAITLTLLYSVGFTPKIHSLTRANKVGPFIFSYVFFVLIIIGLFAGFYDLNNEGFLNNGKETTLNFSNTLYFSIISFTTVGYGDIVPLGANKLVASLESLVAIILNIAFLGYVFGSRRFLHRRKRSEN